MSPLIHQIPLFSIQPTNPFIYACRVRLTWERTTGRLGICGYIFMPFWWESLGLVFKAWCQMVGATCEAKEEKKEKQAWLHNAKTRWEDVTQITHTHRHTQPCNLAAWSQLQTTTLGDVLSQEPRISWGMQLLKYKTICSSHNYTCIFAMQLQQQTQCIYFPLCM